MEIPQSCVVWTENGRRSRYAVSYSLFLNDKIQHQSKLKGSANDIMLLLFMWCLMPFQQYFSNIAAASALYPYFPGVLLTVLSTIFFPSYWMLSHINIVETMDICERGKNIGRAGDRISDLLFSSPVRYQLSYGALQATLYMLFKNRNLF